MADDEDLVAVEHLRRLGIDHRAHHEYSHRIARQILNLMRTCPTDGARDDISGVERTSAIDCAQRRASGQNDDHLLVAVMEMKRRTILAWIDLIERRTESLGAGRRAHTSGTAPQRGIRALYPLRLEEVRHRVDPSSDVMQKTKPCERPPTTGHAPYAWCMSRRPLVAAVVVLALVSSVAAVSSAAAKTHNAVVAHRLIVTVKKNLPSAAEKKLSVLILISQNGGAPAGAVATPSKPLTVHLANRRLYRVTAEIDSSCKGSCNASYRIAGSANHKLEIVPRCQLKVSGFVCSTIKIVKVY